MNLKENNYNCRRLELHAVSSRRSSNRLLIDMAAGHACWSCSSPHDQVEAPTCDQWLAKKCAIVYIYIYIYIHKRASDRSRSSSGSPPPPFPPRPFTSPPRPPSWWQQQRVTVLTLWVSLPFVFKRSSCLLLHVLDALAEDDDGVPRARAPLRLSVP